MISLRQVDSGTLEAVKLILPNVLRESGVPEIPKISNCLFSKGFCSNLVQYTFLTIEIDITLISSVSAHFRENIRIAVFSALALDQGKLGPTLSSYFAFKGQPMVQVTSKTKVFSLLCIDFKTCSELRRESQLLFWHSSSSCKP